jgi:hypothetical protein
MSVDFLPWTQTRAFLEIDLAVEQIADQHQYSNTDNPIDGNSRV